MFDVGGTEIFLILVITLLVMGPKNLPRVARSVGRFMGRIRRLTNEIRDVIDDEVRALELDELKKEMAETKAQLGKKDEARSPVVPASSPAPDRDAQNDQNAREPGGVGAAGEEDPDWADQAPAEEKGKD